MPPSLNSLLRFVGFPRSRYRSNEQAIAALGGFLGIVAVAAISVRLLGADQAVLIVPSMGASAVLIFAVPHSPLTQPWAVLGGHVISALVGVACYQAVSSPLLAGALAVGGAIGAMHLARCIHPPGGATALTAVIGGASLHELGFAYAATPVALNALAILAVGILFNYAFPWRRYPISLMHYAAPVRLPGAWPTLTEAQIDAAMKELKVVLDVSAAEIGQVVEHAVRELARSGHIKSIELGRSYCNEQPGPAWSVRKIVDERPSEVADFDLVVYQVLRGEQKGRLGSCTRTEFARWASSEVQT
ncbi:MAG: HPP family protein [Zoogloeaceae bacterium]|nr:HPP family protein [Zoogloeaceae bacterium]